jgi:exosortase
MSVETKNRDVPRSGEVQEARALDLLVWPYNAWLFGVIFLALYGPIVLETSRVWFQNDNFAHGLFIIPLSCALLWLQRTQIKSARPAPTALGLPLLALGLIVAAASYLLRIKFLGIWSAIPTLAGAILVLHGPELWRIARFPVTFLFWAGPLPSTVYTPVTQWVQMVSTRGAAELMMSLGYTLLRVGNQIQIPGYTLEVADACSGFRKLIALIAFALLYGYIYPISASKRLMLALCAIPVALLANVLRVSVLVAVCSAGGPNALHRAHDSAEIGALILSFVLFVMIGKALGCKTARFSL